MGCGWMGEEIWRVSGAQGVVGRLSGGKSKIVIMAVTVDVWRGVVQRQSGHGYDGGRPTVVCL